MQTQITTFYDQLLIVNAPMEAQLYPLILLAIAVVILLSLHPKTNSYRKYDQFESGGSMKDSTHSEYIPALRFNWLTPFYDLIVGTTTREGVFKKSLIAQAAIQAKHNVLDLACGTGTLAIWAKQHQPLANITGVDGDLAVLSLSRKKAKKNGVHLQFDHAMSYSLPYADATFDRVLSSLFFHHLTWQNKQRTARELFRILKPGAELHIADWGSPTNTLMRGLFLFVQLLDGFKTTQDNVEGKLVTLFRDSGFANVTQRKTFSTIYGTMTLYSATKHG